MCGISGIYASDITEEQKKMMNAVIKNQWHRGPDHQESIFIQGKMSQTLLGHNRLSIIDLSAHANQPMWDDSNRYCIVYNGEIYNYLEIKAELVQRGLQFKTQSDTEVILNAFLLWGINALTKFRGPFAFAILDHQKEELWLCRDRFGVRPLYYVQINDILYFASTSATLAKSLNCQPNMQYLAQGLKYLIYEDGSDISPYEKILSLPAGSYLRTHFNYEKKLLTKIQVYYDLAANVNNLKNTLITKSTDDLLSLITYRLEEAIKIRLRADVPFAISLSGGLDSSSVAAFVNSHHSHTMGFSFSDPRNKKTEGPVVEHCAKFLNMHIEYVWPTATEMIQALYQTITIQESPFATLSIVAQYLLYKRVRSCGIKVLLGGQGGDEVFMGYRKFLFFWLQQLLRQKRYFGVAKNILQMLPIFLSEITSLSAYWRQRHRYLSNNSYTSTTLKLPDSATHDLSHHEQNLWARQMRDIKYISLPTLLRYEDRNAMGNSVESRLPYMDHFLVELGLALPESLKIRAGYGKWAIREIMRDRIPRQIRLARYKRGFDLSLGTLLKEGLGQSIRENIKNNTFVMKEFLKNPQNIEQNFSNHAFLHRRAAMTEAITLLWLNRQYT